MSHYANRVFALCTLHSALCTFTTGIVAAGDTCDASTHQRINASAHQRIFPKESIMTVYHREPDSVYFVINPHDVNYVNRILESYEYLGILTTLDPARALCVVHSTADTKGEVEEILRGLSIPVEFIGENGGE
jgi:hypothetical protein